MDARSKLIVLLVYSAALFFVGSLPGMALYTVAFVVTLIISKLPASRVFVSAIPVYIIVAVTLVCHSLVYISAHSPDSASYLVEGISFSFEGFMGGCVIGLRILLLTWMSVIFCFSTTSTQITSAFAWFMKPISKWSRLGDDIAMVLSIAIRFIPAVAAEFSLIREAQWSRGAEFDSGSIFGRIKASCLTLMPVVVGLFRKADQLSKSMDSRCYGLPNVTRTYHCVGRYTLKSFFCALIISTVLISIVLIA